MKKQGLEDKINVAWFRATGRNDGWDVFREMVYKNTQEDIARKFDVGLATSQRWHKQFRAMRQV